MKRRHASVDYLVAQGVETNRLLAEIRDYVDELVRQFARLEMKEVTVDRAPKPSRREPRKRV